MDDAFHKSLKIVHDSQPSGKEFADLEQMILATLKAEFQKELQTLTKKK